jgi:hypothetical protein
MMWIVLGGPATVVLASVVTLVLAIRGGDVPLRAAQAVQPETLTPASQARNHVVAPRR